MGDGNSHQRAVQRAKQDRQAEALAPLVAAKIQIKADIPWYESTLLWGAFSAAAAIVITVVATMTKDLRWMLILAWPFFLATAWAGFKNLRSRRLQTILTSVLSLVIAVCLYGLARLHPSEPQKTESKSISKEHEPSSMNGESRIQELPKAEPSLSKPQAKVEPTRELTHALAFHALDTEIGNLPERKKVSLTWDGKAWDEQRYSDVRLTIDDIFEFQLESIDLTISAMDAEEHLGIAGIGQLSDVSGLEFHPPKMPEPPPLSLRGTDGKSYRLDLTDMFGKMWLPAREFRIFCPRLLPKEPLRLIIATVRDNGTKKPAASLRVRGVYETAPSEGSVRGKVDQTVAIEQ